MRLLLACLIASVPLSGCDTQDPSRGGGSSDICVSMFPCLDFGGSTGSGIDTQVLAQAHFVGNVGAYSTATTRVYGKIWAGCPAVGEHALEDDRPFTCSSSSDTVDVRISSWQCQGYSEPVVVTTESGRIWSEVNHPVAWPRIEQEIEEHVVGERVIFSLPCEGGEVGVTHQPLAPGE